MSRVLLGAALLSTLVLAGCVMMVPTFGPGGAMPGMIVNDINYPSALNPSMSHEINIARSDIELKGWVESTSESMSILGVFGKGDSGYGKLLETARAQGADGIMNITIDTKVQAYVFGAYQKITTHLSGVAYKYK
ncbi:MAG: hypothetical protein JXQ29_16005 [Planctomycetes bacterium]|nr:hypothetical protein [Planctomycetota bacterium]